jgi:hypothetical protein
MRKNVDNQFVSCQLLDTAGAAVTTGTTTVYLTGNGGTQAAVGTATHKGNGEWQMTLSAANTNYDHVSITWVNTGAVPVTQNVYTDQAADLVAALTIPTAAENRAEMDANSTQLAAILAGTETDIPALVNGLNDIDAIEVRAALGVAAADLDAQLSAIVEDTGTTIPALINGLNNLNSSDAATAVWSTVCESEGSYTAQQILSVVLAVLAGVTRDGGVTITTPNGVGSRVYASVDSNNNRTSMTINPSS